MRICEKKWVKPKKETLLPLFENIDSKEVFVIHCAAVVYIKTAILSGYCFIMRIS